MGIPSRISHFSSVTGLLLAGLSCAALVVACSSDDDNTSTGSGTDTGTSTTADAGTPSDAAATSDTASDAGADADADITTVSGDSGTHSYTVSVTVSGLAGTGLVLQNNGGDNLTITADGTFPFATPVADGASYGVTVLANPTGPTQQCIPSSASGPIAGANITNVTVACTTSSFKVGGTITGLVATGLVLTNNGVDDLTVDPAAGTAFTFETSVASGAAYDVEVKTQPVTATPEVTAQICAVDAKTNKSTVGAADVTSAAISCVDAYCATASENQTATLTCPAGQTIKSVDFANYGTPAGMCGAFAADVNVNDDALPHCSLDVSAKDAVAACIGKATCNVAATNGNFPDPCVGTGKRLYLQATCQ